MMPETPYSRSLTRAMRIHGGIEPFVHAFVGLPAKVAVKEALDVVALIGADVQHSSSSNVTSIRASTLALQGYDLRTSRSLYNLFMDSFEDEFSPEMAMLMPKAMLIEKFGVNQGTLLADMLVDPKCQPVLHTMLFGNLGNTITTAVERQCVEATFVAAINQYDRTKPGWEDHLKWEQREMKPLLRPGEAEQMFTQATDGCTLQRIVALPLLFEDYRYASPLEEAPR